jgi:Reverse transcriptase (RNA-dependent DNA polymerase)
MQKFGVDYLEIFAPVLRLNTLRLLLCLVAHNSWNVRQLDVKTAFLNGVLDEDTEIYMEQPPHFVEPGTESKVCKLQKSIYGLKQAPRCWYVTLHKYFVEVGFVRCAQEVCLYIKRVGDSVVLLSV